MSKHERKVRTLRLSPKQDFELEQVRRGLEDEWESNVNANTAVLHAIEIAYQSLRQRGASS